MARHMITDQRRRLINASAKVLSSLTECFQPHLDWRGIRITGRREYSALGSAGLPG